jgi:hypothetical protein
MLADGLNRFFRSDDDKVKVAEQVLRLLKDSPALEEARRARDEKRLATIRERIVERDRIKREQAETMPRLQRAVVASQ